MAEIKELKEQINLVVVARRLAQEASANRAEAYQSWFDLYQHLFDNENNAKVACQEAEAQLREMALSTYAITGDKAVAPGIGIRELTKLNYDAGVAFNWAIEHKLALKLDVSAFEKMVKANPLSFDFVSITEEPTATIATELAKVE